MSAPEERRLARQTAVIMGLAAPFCLGCIAAAYALLDRAGLAGGWQVVRNLWDLALVATVGGAALGYASGLFHQQWLAFHEEVLSGKREQHQAPERLMRPAVLRFFAHLPFSVAPIFFGVLWATVASLLGRRASPADSAPADLDERGSGLAPLWVQLGPLMFALPQDGEFPGAPPTLHRLVVGMPRWAWWLPVMIVVASRGGEIFGEPLVLLTLGTYWVGDSVALWWVLRARLGGG